jgi:hypothetical protein
MKLRQTAKRFLVAASLFALLTASVPELAQSLSESNLPTCCNSIYCPMHRYQASEQQTDKSDCDSHGNSAGNDCSMRACETVPKPVVGTAPFVLVAPRAVRYQASTEPLRIQATRFVPIIVSIPLTPPPRTIPS